MYCTAASNNNNNYYYCYRYRICCLQTRTSFGELVYTIMVSSITCIVQCSFPTLHSDAVISIMHVHDNIVRHNTLATIPRNLLTQRYNHITSCYLVFDIQRCSCLYKLPHTISITFHTRINQRGSSILLMKDTSE